MNKIKNDYYYIEKALENINIIISYTNNLDYKEFINNELLIDAIRI